MCRSHAEGYRRCEADNSYSRQERRISNKIKNQVSESLHKKIEKQDYQDSNGFRDIDSIKVVIHEIQDSIKNIYTLTEEEVRGLKNKIIDIGQGISSIAYNNLEIDEEYIFLLEKAEAKRIELEYEKAKASYSSKSLELSKKYNIMNMDVPYNLSLMFDKDGSHDKAELKTDYNYIINCKKKVDDLYVALREAKSIGTKEANIIRKRLQEEYISIISNLRELGGDLKVHPKSNKAQLSILKDASNIFPKEWIEISNRDGENLLIKNTKARAHYTESATQRSYKLYDSGYIKTTKADEAPNGTRWESGWVELEVKNGEATFIDSSGFEHYYTVRDGEKAYYVPNWEYYSPYYNTFDHSKGKPKGNGWQEVTIKDFTWNRETNEKTYEDIKTWRRVKKERRAVGFTSTAELLIDNSKDTALHEFMHRVEAKYPTIGKIEEIFVKDRTTDDAGLREPFVKLYGRSKEVARPDNFVSDYMGKHYSDSKHWEVLSTGVEAVFGDSYGSLLGLSDFKKDLNHRDFVLGVFASL